MGRSPGNHRAHGVMLRALPNSSPRRSTNDRTLDPVWQHTVHFRWLSLGFLASRTRPAHWAVPQRRRLDSKLAGGLELPLHYLVAVGGVLLFQVAFSYAIILASRGDGSFVGLGAMLLAVPGIPLTALLNTLLIRSRRNNPASPYAGRLLVVSLALPVAQLALLVLVSVFRL